MDNYLNPLMNPDLGMYRDPEPDADRDEQTVNQLEGRMGNIWTNGDLNDSLQHLIHVCRDGQEGYLQAAERVKSAWLQGLFQSFSTQREQFVTELSNLAEGLGILPDSGTTLADVLHRTWVDLRAAFTGVDSEDAAILDECERGEDAAKEAYETELNKGLPEHIHSVVQSQYQAILQAHDQVRETRDAFPR
jgi:uncharacterized protein (TIGR02284 family)